MQLPSPLISKRFPQIGLRDCFGLSIIFEGGGEVSGQDARQLSAESMDECQPRLAFVTLGLAVFESR